MADTRISALTQLTSLADDDELVVVDKSDLTMAASGTTKRVRFDTIADQVDVFTANGTWTKPTGAVSVDVLAIGSGAGGGSGRRGAAATVRCGGGGGGAGGVTMRAGIPAVNLGATVSVVVSAGGAGGAAVATDDTNGAAGSVGATTTCDGGQPDHRPRRCGHAGPRHVRRHGQGGAGDRPGCWGGDRCVAAPTAARGGRPAPHHVHACLGGLKRMTVSRLRSP